MITYIRAQQPYNYQLAYYIDPIYRSIKINNHPIKNMIDVGYYAEDFSLLSPKERVNVYNATLRESK